MEQFAIGDRVTSLYGHEHRGVIIEVAAFKDGETMYVVKRDSDGFEWIGLPVTVLAEHAYS